MMEQTYLRLLEIVNGYTIIDTHEHLPAWETERNYNTDVINEYLTHYFNRDLISAGLSQADLSKVLDTSIPIIERWYLLEPYWTVCRKTGYGRSLDITVKGLYNIEEINGKTIEELNDAFLKSMKPGWYKHVLKERSKIQTSILDCKTLM